MNRKLLIQMGSITPSAILLGLLYIDNYYDFFTILPISWAVAYYYATCVRFHSNSMRHFFSVITLFLMYSIWGLHHLFPFPNFYEKSIWIMGSIILFGSLITLAFLTCCTKLYTVFETKMMQCFGKEG